MLSEEERKRIEAVIDKELGGTEGVMIRTLLISAIAEQPIDITTVKGKRFLEVTVDPSFIYPLIYGAGPRRRATVMENIKIKDRQGHKSMVSFNDIWIILPMPKEGFTDEELRGVNIADGEQVNPSTGEKLRDMIRNSYHCKDESEVDYFLRRYLAS